MLNTGACYSGSGGLWWVAENGSRRSRGAARRAVCRALTCSGDIPRLDGHEAFWDLCGLAHQFTTIHATVAPPAGAGAVR